jgi:hypothetical protein
MAHANFPTGVALKVTDRKGLVTYPSYEAYGWENVNSIIQATQDMEQVARVEIVNIGMRRIEGDE